MLLAFDELTKVAIQNQHIILGEELKKGVPLKVLVDSMTPVQNITRFAANAGYQVTHQSVGSDFELTITK